MSKRRERICWPGQMHENGLSWRSLAEGWGKKYKLK